MKETRLFKRIPCSGEGVVEIEDAAFPVSPSNLSKGGVCLKIAKDTWDRLCLDDCDQLRGQLTVDGDLFRFEGRICWSHTNPPSVFFGIEFKNHDRHVLNDVLERLSILEDLPPQDSFAI